MKLFLLLCFLPLIFTQNGFTDDVREQLHNAGSFEELLDTVEVYYDPEETHSDVDPEKWVKVSREDLETPASEEGQMAYPVRPILQGRSAKQTKRIFDKYYTEKGEDGCYLLPACVSHELPITNVTDYYPPCYEVNKCMGSCCSNRNSCVPLGFQRKKIQIATLHWTGKKRKNTPIFTLGRNEPFEVKEPTSCGCKPITCDTPPSCKEGFALGSNCECEPINFNDRNMPDPDGGPDYS